MCIYNTFVFSHKLLFYLNNISRWRNYGSSSRVHEYTYRQVLWINIETRINKLYNNLLSFDVCQMLITSSCIIYSKHTYATPAAGGIIYSLNVFCFVFFGKTVRTHYCKYLYSVKSGWSQITCKLTQNIYFKILYSMITL